MKSNGIVLPIQLIKTFMRGKDYKRIRHFLTLLLDVYENGNQGWYLEELVQLLKYQPQTLRDRLQLWVQEGWMVHLIENQQSIYYLNPISQTDGLEVDKDHLMTLFQSSRNIELYSWLYLQFHPMYRCSLANLMKAFQIEHQEGVYRVLRELEWNEVLQYERVIEGDDVILELDYSTSTIQIYDLIIPTYESRLPFSPSQELRLPKPLLKWLTQAKDFSPIKLYCEWFLFVERFENYPLTLNQLIQLVFTNQNHHSLTEHLQNMMDIGMISMTETPLRHYQLCPFQTYTISLNRTEFERGLATLKPKEFALWLSLQLTPTEQLTVQDICHRINCLNPVQARNILNRLSDTEWVTLSRPNRKIAHVQYQSIAYAI